MHAKAVCRYPAGHVLYRRLTRTYPRIVRGEGCWLYDDNGERYLDGGLVHRVPLALVPECRFDEIWIAACSPSGRRELDAELVYAKRVRKGSLDRYTATTPPHIQAARKAGGRAGAVVRYVITEAGPEPVLPGRTLPAPIDRRHYVERVLRQEEQRFAETLEQGMRLLEDDLAGLQGKVIAGGLMLMWPCDLVVAADTATFQDPVVAFGANGVEYIFGDGFLSTATGS